MSDCNQDCNQGRECDCADDLVKRLRDASAIPTGLYSEAADEIERLCDELASCTADLSREVSIGNDYLAQMQQARKDDRIAMSYLSEIRQAVEHDGDFPSLVEHCRTLKEEQKRYIAAQQSFYAPNAALRKQQDELVEALKDAANALEKAEAYLSAQFAYNALAKIEGEK